MDVNSWTWDLVSNTIHLIGGILLKWCWVCDFVVVFVVRMGVGRLGARRDECIYLIVIIELTWRINKWISLFDCGYPR
jgi:hypothetical protein